MSIIIKTTIFRYKTDPLLQEELEYFAKVHQFDDKKSLKENYKKWSEQENISKLIEQETRRLESLNYQGNVLQKLFTSLKYYHIKNLRPQLKIEPEPEIKPSVKKGVPLPSQIGLNESTNDNAPPQNKKSKKEKQKSPAELLQKIEKHILFMLKPQIPVITISPNDAFKDYLVNEMAVEKDEEVIKKVKKIYKNKMFHLQKKLTKNQNTINDAKPNDNISTDDININNNAPIVGP